MKPVFNIERDRQANVTVFHVAVFDMEDSGLLLPAEISIDVPMGCSFALEVNEDEDGTVLRLNVRHGESVAPYLLTKIAMHEPELVRKLYAAFSFALKPVMHPKLNATAVQSDAPLQLSGGVGVVGGGGRFSGVMSVLPQSRLGFWATILAAALGLGLIGYGVAGKYLPGKTESVAIGENTTQGQGFEDIQAKVRQQIEQMNEGGLQGQNVAADTMRAMGLDPGKANSGCLVGIKP